MENNYIQQLQQILKTQFVIPDGERESIIDNYKVTVQTIIDETGHEESVIDQLGTPESLAEELASEFNFSRSTTSQQSETIHTHSQQYKKKPHWPIIIIFSIIVLFLGFPLIFAIFSTLIAFLIMPIGFLISSIVFLPSLISHSPWFILSLFLAGASTLALLILLIIIVVRGLIFCFKKAFSIQIEKKAKKRVPFAIVITLIVISIISNTAVFSLPFTDPYLRSKIPGNMFVFTSFNNKTKTFTKDFAPQEIEQLQIKGSGIHIKTIESNDDQFHIQLDTVNGSIDNAVQIDNKKLIIKESNINSCIFCFDLGHSKTKLQLAIPKNTSFDFASIEILGGHAELDSIQAKTTNFKLTGGEIKIGNLKSDDSTVKITGGAINISSSQIQSTLNLDVTGGSADFDSLDADTANFDLKGGSVDVRSSHINKISKDIKGGSLNI
ncbi:MAG: DUF4097 family beta strand repeat-containing protein [Culicoidibacterales bacterium]